jgi:hypothetical protein
MSHNIFKVSLKQQGFPPWRLDESIFSAALGLPSVRIVRFGSGAPGPAERFLLESRAHV